MKRIRGLLSLGKNDTERRKAAIYPGRAGEGFAKANSDILFIKAGRDERFKTMVHRISCFRAFMEHILRRLCRK